MSGGSSRASAGAGKAQPQVPFQSNLELLRLFLAHRQDIVERMEAVLNAQRKPVQYLQDHSLLSRHFEDCFAACSPAAASQIGLRSQLEQAHWAAGFRPRPIHDLHNHPIHPAEMMIRAFYCWRQTRWPGRNGRLHYAHTLFNLYVLRWLQFLSMRLWDEDPSSPAARLSEIQRVLDQLWKTSPAGQPAFVRDARWLIPLAQSLITDELAPYFDVARQVTEALPQPDALEIWKAHVRMLGGHLTSQIRYYSSKDAVPIDHPTIVLRTRASNALDFALLVQGLVTLLNAYDRALHSGEERMRLDLAAAICQGISADPELFLNRIGLLRAYSMIEHVFIATGADGQAVYSPQGRRHVEFLERYAASMARLIEPLREDFPRFRPVDGGCSPYGVIFGLPSHLLEHMALKAVQHDAETRFSLEDVFNDVSADAGLGAAKLAWVNGWRQLPHIGREAQQLYAYPQPFAEEIFNRIQRELSGTRRHATGSLYIQSADAPDADSQGALELPAHYFRSSDTLLHERREAHFLVSYQTPAERVGLKWVGLKKDLLTDVLGAGRDARVTGLPPHAAQVLRLMCAGLVHVRRSGE